MMKSFQELCKKGDNKAYEKGYSDGLRMAIKVQWQGTPIADQLRGSSYQPDEVYRATYEEGFRHGIEDGSEVKRELSETMPYMRC